MISTKNKNRMLNSLTTNDTYRTDNLKLRRKDHLNEKRVNLINYNSQAEAQAGWTEVKQTQTQVILQKKKNEKLLLEDRLWKLLYNMGYKTINKQSYNSLYYSEDDTYVDFSLLACDGETVLFLDCLPSRHIEDNNLQGRLSILQDILPEIKEACQTIFEAPTYHTKLAFRYVIAITGNRSLRNEEKDIIENRLGGIILLDHNIEYFENMYSQIREASKYQFLGYIFQGQEIPNIKTKIPAIKGNMAGNTFYSFSIDPKVLLKMSYVLHRNNANSDAMPTYQRLVKGARLRGITEFLNNNGFFPNSIVINLDSECEFEEIEGQKRHITKIGYLNIPKKFRTAYIIDGQHRLLAYAGCRHANQSIPVVAFQNLNKATQVKLFMQINENQKAVPRGLKNTLNQDLLWDDPRISQRLLALRLKIAFTFGDNIESPLRGYCEIGEDKNVYTSQMFINALRYSTGYYGTFNDEGEQMTDGIFLKDNNLDEAYNDIRDFLFKCVRLLVDNIGETLDTPRENIFLRNIGMEGYLKFVYDVLMLKKHQINKNATPDDKYNLISDELTCIIEHAQNICSETKIDLTARAGGAAPTHYQRTFQKWLHEINSNYTFAGLDNYWANNSEEVYQEALEAVNRLETMLLTQFEIIFRERPDTNWEIASLPNNIYKTCNLELANWEYANPGLVGTRNAWQFVELRHLYEISMHTGNDILLKRKFSDPEMSRGAAKRVRYQWISQLSDIKARCIREHACDEKSLILLRKMINYYEEKFPEIIPAIAPNAGD